jgi:hypothetical protein
MAINKEIGLWYLLAIFCNEKIEEEKNLKIIGMETYWWWWCWWEGKRKRAQIEKLH